MFEVFVNGEKRELSCLDHGVDCSMDLIGNMGDLTYDRENQRYTMDEEKFAFWKNTLAVAQENRELESKLLPDEIESLRVQTIGGAYKDEIKDLEIIELGAR